MSETMTRDQTAQPSAAIDPLIDSRTAAWRLLATLCIGTLGALGMYILPVTLPEIQAEFGITRAQASLPYTLTMIGFGLGGMVCGRWVDRYGVRRVIVIGALGVMAGFTLAGLAGNVWVFGFAHGALIGLVGTASCFVPLMADTSLWWNKRRGIAVAISACGNYLSGALFPPIIHWGVETIGWRHTYIALGLLTGLGMLLLSHFLRQRPPALQTAAVSADAGSSTSASTGANDRPFGLSPGRAQAALFIAGIGCCTAMSMPQVHIVAYCSDLGYGAGQGAQMLSLMLAMGVISRLASGWISDRIGGQRTLMLGSTLQGLALLMFLPFDSLASLYVISALFGLFQGGIVPSYTIIVRENFSPAEAGQRVGTVILGTMIGMALGGWMSGKIFDLTGSYHAAFINGMAWNLLNFSIVLWLLLRARRLLPAKATAPAL